ncbi:hypothetical protein N5P37_003358 [Trichoderma harzianum]|uniref:Uncharacterized protein n=1 Tax=Trichoderma harzianum CBS 226.95 TaxID=983964 RepID=A0A2T4AU52_TRIHA|nr:hypothetical protein M431DRAFT_477064 [Trichoderma harzianum CBS 226.95]KAK0763966.1 hypothetical protein N5P37_003358 [Trichoderma harzianum]PTB60600.1 hypothetical protein M431DRAFT_477064 [Trichoderma harzianum CBS 226.95]
MSVPQACQRPIVIGSSAVISVYGHIHTIHAQVLTNLTTSYTHSTAQHLATTGSLSAEQQPNDQLICKSQSYHFSPAHRKYQRPKRHSSNWPKSALPCATAPDALTSLSRREMNEQAKSPPGRHLTKSGCTSRDIQLRPEIMNKGSCENV